MGEIADEILSGYRDAATGAVIDGKEPGHARSLTDHFRAAARHRKNKKRAARRKRAAARKKEEQT